MSGDQLSSSSFGDPNAHSPTPRQTPTSATFPSPLLSTPTQQPSRFYDSAGLTPRFAEDFSVFESTPGGLHASQDTFTESIPVTPTKASSGHKRPLSTKLNITGFQPYQGLHPPNSKYQRLHAEYSGLEASSNYPLNVANGPSKGSRLQTSSTSNPLSPNREGIREGEGTQLVTPPPTTHKGKRKLAPRLKMQDDQMFGQPDMIDTSQTQDINAFLGHTGDMFGYPMSAPVTGPESFWDPSALNLPMDMDFGPATQNLFPQSATPSHRPSGSFDWNSEVPLFETAQGTAPGSSQETIRQPPRRERAIAPKPPASEQISNASMGDSMVTSFSTSEDPFGLVPPTAGAVNPGMLFSRPQTSVGVPMLSLNTSLGLLQNQLAPVQIQEPTSTGIRHTTSTKENQAPERRLASSPVKPAASRPGLGRSNSENRGRRSQGRGSATNQNSGLRPIVQPRPSPNLDTSRGNARQSGRASPLKMQHRLSDLASIPESATRAGSRASIRFTIDSNGRARAEASQPFLDPRAEASATWSRASNGSQSWNGSEDESSSDDEPIIIPSRSTSFNKSFALPDPLKPVGSIFHSTRRSISDRSTSTQGASDTPAIVMTREFDSEPDTPAHGVQDQDGDATNELLKVVENRRNRPKQLSSARLNRFISASQGNLRDNTVSPASLEFGDIIDGHGIRCVCHRNSGDENDGFMIQCESCEFWLHGDCLNITKRTMPRVYICMFCVRTPPGRGGRPRRNGNGGYEAACSPLANKSFKMLR